MTKIYTKTGDCGTTALIGGQRVPKYDARVDAYGTVDELSAHLAMLHDLMVAYGESGFDEEFVSIQKVLMTTESLLALGDGCQVKFTDISPEHVAHLEHRIDELSAELPPIERFTIPGGHVVVSECHICRTVCRRAERKALLVQGVSAAYPNAYAYLNRLSDYLYVLGRVLALRLNAAEILWEPE